MITGTATYNTVHISYAQYLYTLYMYVCTCLLQHLPIHYYTYISYSMFALELKQTTPVTVNSSNQTVSGECIIKFTL